MMMFKVLGRAAAAVAAACVAFACAGAALADEHPLILISIDGFRADYLDRGVSPTLSALAADGVRATAMRPSFPSLTFPNHYTLVTGLRPDHHGIVNNTMEDPAWPGVTFKLSDRAQVQDARWWNDAAPLWVSAEQQGVRTATMFWPGSEAAIRGVRPSHWKVYGVGEYPADARVDTVLSWLDLPAAQRPRFITLYFDDVDTAGHFDGPDSPKTNAAITHVDAAIGRLVAGLKARGLWTGTNLVVVADHGMAAIPADHVIYLDDLAPADSFRLVSGNAVGGVEPRPGRQADVENALLGAHPHFDCWRKSQIPAHLHYGTHRRVPAIVCLAEKGWLLRLHSSKGHVLVGEHGYDPADPDMAALFVAHGPAFAHGVTLPAFDNVDVYPLLTTVLGVKPEPNDGHLDEVKAALASPPA
jgi:predicted AlkP superfamily pyrophosphatase or phosphodiesterase